MSGQKASRGQRGGALALLYDNFKLPFNYLGISRVAATTPYQNHCPKAGPSLSLPSPKNLQARIRTLGM